MYDIVIKTDTSQATLASTMWLLVDNHAGGSRLGTEKGLDCGYEASRIPLRTVKPG